jgi:hypothetical protein
VSLKKKGKKKPPLPSVDASAGAALHTHTYIYSVDLLLIRQSFRLLSILFHQKGKKNEREKRKEIKSSDEMACAFPQPQISTDLSVYT